MERALHLVILDGGEEGGGPLLELAKALNLALAAGGVRRDGSWACFCVYASIVPLLLERVKARQLNVMTRDEYHEAHDKTYIAAALLKGETGNTQQAAEAAGSYCALLKRALGEQK